MPLSVLRHIREGIRNSHYGSGTVFSICRWKEAAGDSKEDRKSDSC